jgi:hypothetical protein
MPVSWTILTLCGCERAGRIGDEKANGHPEMAEEMLAEYGDPAGSRTQNTRLKRPVLCQLSYRVEGRSLAQLALRGQG